MKGVSRNYCNESKMRSVGETSRRESLKEKKSKVREWVRDGGKGVDDGGKREVRVDGRG